MTFNKKHTEKGKEKDDIEKPTLPLKKRAISGFTRAMQRAVNSENAQSEDISLYSIYASLGQFLYRIGFEAEYFMLCTRRGLSRAFAYLYRHFKSLLIKLLTVAGYILHLLTDDFKEPILRAKSGFDNIRTVIHEEKEQGKAHAAKEGLAYFRRGLHRYRHLIFNLASYLLPIGACCIFVFTASTMLNYTYALSVNYNGENLGFIANENVYEEAQNQVRSRIKGTDSAKDWQAKPDFKLTVTDAQDTLDTYTTLADSLVRTSSAEIMDATGIEVDGELLGVTTNGAMLQATLDEMKSKYQDPDKAELRVEFVKDVKLLNGLYLTSSITEADAIVAELTGEVEGQKLYTVVKGDSPQLIAEKNDIPLKDLQMLNPAMNEAGYNMPIGSQLLVSRSENFLQVKTIEKSSYTEVIPHNTEKRETDKLYKNKSNTIQKGQDGERAIEAEIVRVDGIEVDRIILSDVVTIEPVDEIVEVGNKSTYSTSGSTVGSGAFVHPVPGRSYITTRFGQGGHRGLDLCAPYGTPIFACDSGSVIEAGYHGSFGNYILINHGNGMTTRYCHMSGFAVTGGTVARGQLIGYVGQTGNASGNHCHLEVTAGGRLINPAPMIGE